MKVFKAKQVRILTNEAIANEELLAHEKYKTPFASDLKLLQIFSDILDASSNGYHSIRHYYDASTSEYDAVLEVAEHFRSRGYEVEIPDYSNTINISW